MERQDREWAVSQWGKGSEVLAARGWDTGLDTVRDDW